MSDFPIIPADDTVLVLTHMQNEFAHPDGKGTRIVYQFLKESEKGLTPYRYASSWN